MENYTYLNESYSYNSTYADYDAFDSQYSVFIDDSPGTIILICFYVPVFIMALLGNILILLVVFRNKGMGSVTNYFLVNLAIADLLGK